MEKDSEKPIVKTKTSSTDETGVGLHMLLRSAGIELARYGMEQFVFNMNKPYFIEYLERAQKNKELDSISTRLIVFKAEALQLAEKLGSKKAEEKTITVETEYQNLRHYFESLRDQKVPLEKILNRITRVRLKFE